MVVNSELLTNSGKGQIPRSQERHFEPEVGVVTVFLVVNFKLELNRLQV